MDSALSPSELAEAVKDLPGWIIVDDKLYKKFDELDFESVKYKRFVDMMDNIADNTPERLAAKEIVTNARLSQLKRSL